MVEEAITDLRETYQKVASAVGIPDGWFLRIETAKWVAREMEDMGTFGMDERLDRIAMPLLVDDSGTAHIVAEHKGTVTSICAKRELESALDEHPSS